MIYGRHKSEVPTPALLLDIEAAYRNIERMANFAKDAGCALRPHIKTHKLPFLAHRQISAGAIGITCAKLSEAEVFLRSGITDILIANEVVEPEKIKKLVGLASLAHLMVCVDNESNAIKLNEAAKEAGLRKLDILLEINVGLNRCGVLPGKPALELASKLSRMKHLNIEGVMGYEGALFEMLEKEKHALCNERNSKLVETAELLERNGFNIKIVSAGGSNTSMYTGNFKGITEIQVGSYATMDGYNRKHGMNYEQAITIMATVISTSQKNIAVIDVGMKAVSTDKGLPDCVDGRMKLKMLNEEHGYIDFSKSSKPLKVGSKIELIPAHGCTTIPFYNSYLIVRGGYVAAVMPIAARDGLQ
jgi:D-serine deaminase-like pyridoxal phosphate-dependent protein